jgi:hypothetical protein
MNDSIEKRYVKRNVDQSPESLTLGCRRGAEDGILLRTSSRSFSGMWHRSSVLTWNSFAVAEPALASACRAMMYQFGVGLAFLATVRPDGGPRVHPMCPLIAESGLFAFVIPSPKRDDLHRDGRYAMHSFPADENENAFYLAGMAELVDDRERRRALEVQFFHERGLEEPPTGFHEQELFVFQIERCLYTLTTGHGDPEPRHRIWRAP